MKNEELERQTSLPYWFPVVQKLGIFHPRTEIIESSRVAGMEGVGDIVDGKMPECWKGIVDECKEKGKALGEPLFVRTDQLSGKHSWKDTCYCPKLENISQHLGALIEETMMHFGVSFGCFVLREFLPLKTVFIAFWGQMPINREFRFFTREDKVVHIQPYWPPDAIRDHVKDEEWEKKLAEISELDKSEMVELGNIAKLVGAKLGGNWSIDFAQTVDGDWHLIDMARAEGSFYWPGKWAGSRFIGEKTQR